MLEQERETPREYLDRESHFVWGKRYLLRVIETDEAPYVELTPRTMFLHIRSGADDDRKQEVIEDWYREQVRGAVPALLSKWQPLIGVQVDRFFVRKMKTRWGSCTARTKSIRLNTDLAKKPPVCLEYIVVHELVHLLEPTHNSLFTGLMDRFMPKWQLCRAELNRLPVRHEKWDF